MKKKIAAFLIVILFLATGILQKSPIVQAADSDFAIKGDTLTKYTGTEENVVIPKGVKAIGEEAFRDCISLKSVSIPNSVTKIGVYAFMGCKSLKNVSIPDSVTLICVGAFAGCESLKNVSIPDGVDSIANSAFALCYSLESVSIPDSVTSINNSAFKKCKSLKSVNIPNGVTSIDNYAFKGCTSLKNVSIPDSVTSIGEDVLGSCTSLTSIQYKGKTYKDFDSFWKAFKNTDTSSSKPEEETKNPSSTETGEKKPSASTSTGTKNPSTSTEKETQKPSSSKKFSVSATNVVANAKGVIDPSSILVNTGGTGCEVTCKDSWIKVSGQKNGASSQKQLSISGDGRFYLLVGSNDKTTKREGTITVVQKNGNGRASISVIQSALVPELIVNSNKKQADSSGNFYDNTVSVKTQGTGGFTAEIEEGSSWLSFYKSNITNYHDGLSRLTFNNSGRFYLAALKNSGKTRTAVIKIMHAAGNLTEKITVTQPGNSDLYLEVDRETVYFDGSESAVSKAVKISTNIEKNWTVTSSKKWIKIMESNSSSAKKYSSLEGHGFKKFYVYVDKNGSYKDRDGIITISAPGVEKREIVVNQVRDKKSLASLLEELDVRTDKKKFGLSQTAKIQFGYPVGLYASDIKSVTYSWNNKKVITVEKDGTVKPLRKGEAVISVKVVLRSGASKTFRLAVTVGTREITIAKQD